MSAVRVRVVDRLLVEVQVVVAERALHVERSCAIFAADRVACMPGRRRPLLRRGDRRSARRRNPALFEADVHPLCGPSATSRTAATCSRSSAAPPAPSSGRGRPPRRRLGGGVVDRHLPAAARPRAWRPCGPTVLRHGRSAAHVACRAGARRAPTWSMRCSCSATCPRLPSPATTARRRSAHPRPRTACASPLADARRRATSGSWRSSISGSIPPRSPSPTRRRRRDAGRAAGLDPLRRRARARPALAPLLRRRHPAGHAHDRVDGLGADAPDVHLRAGAAGAGLARRSA